MWICSPALLIFSTTTLSKHATMKRSSLSFKTCIALVFFLGLGSVKAQESMLCVGGHWTEDEANLKMKEFRSSWNDLESWEARAETIREGIIDGMQLDKMPVIEGQFHPVIHHRREMDSYVVENIAIESFQGFWIFWESLYPLYKRRRKIPQPCFVPTDMLQIALHPRRADRSAALAPNGGDCFCLRYGRLRKVAAGHAPDAHCPVAADLQ